MLCVLLLFSLAGMVATGVCEAGSGAFSSLLKLVGKVRCCTCVRRSRLKFERMWSTHATLLYSLCLALCLLLVVCGDVETNPGPISSKRKHRIYVASFPGPAQLPVACSTVLQATGSWAGPGNEASFYGSCMVRGIGVVTKRPRKGSCRIVMPWMVPPQNRSPWTVRSRINGPPRTEYRSHTWSPPAADGPTPCHGVPSECRS